MRYCWGYHVALHGVLHWSNDTCDRLTTIMDKPILLDPRLSFRKCDKLQMKIEFQVIYQHSFYCLQKIDHMHQEVRKSIRNVHLIEMYQMYEQQTFFKDPSTFHYLYILYFIMIQNFAFVCLYCLWYFDKLTVIENLKIKHSKDTQTMLKLSTANTLHIYKYYKYFFKTGSKINLRKSY